MKRKPRKILLLVIFVIASALLVSCVPANQPIDHLWASMGSYKLQHDKAGSDYYFTFQVDDTMLAEKRPIYISGRVVIDSGQIRPVLLSPNGNEAWNGGMLAKGDHSIHTTVISEQTGTYKIGFQWTDGASAKVDMSWHAIKISPWVLLPGLGMLAVALACIVYVLVHKLGARYLGLGALAWVVTESLIVLIAVPLSRPIYQALNVTPPITRMAGWNYLLAYLYLGAMVGMIGVLVPVLLLRCKRLGQASWGKAIAFSIGFGAVGALMQGLSSSGNMFFVLSFPNIFPAPSIAEAARANNPFYGLALIADCISVIAVRVFCCLLLFYSVRKGQYRWFWLSFAFNILADNLSGFAQFWNIVSLVGIWAVEIALAGFGFMSAWGITRLRSIFPEAAIPCEQITVESGIEL